MFTLNYPIQLVLKLFDLFSFQPHSALPPSPTDKKKIQLNNVIKLCKSEQTNEGINSNRQLRVRYMLGLAGYKFSINSRPYTAPEYCCSSVLVCALSILLFKDDCTMVGKSWIKIYTYKMCVHELWQSILSEYMCTALSRQFLGGLWIIQQITLQ